MEMQAPTTWPYLARLVRQLPKRVAKNGRVLNAFKKYGEFTDTDVKKARAAHVVGPELRRVDDSVV